MPALTPDGGGGRRRERDGHRMVEGMGPQGPALPERNRQPMENKKVDSIFSKHYIFHDFGEGPDEATKKLCKIARERTGDKRFFTVPQMPYHSPVVAEWVVEKQLAASLMGDLAYNSLLVGIGMGGLLAARMQAEFPLHVNAVLAVYPPFGAELPPLRRGTRTILYPYKEGYARFQRTDGSLRAYGLPCLIHGPALAPYAIYSLIRKCTLGGDLWEQIERIRGNDGKDDGRLWEEP